MEFLHANSKNYLRYLHFLFLYFLCFFSTNEDFEHLSMKKDTLIKLSGSGNQKLFLPICWRNI